MTVWLQLHIQQCDAKRYSVHCDKEIAANLQIWTSEISDCLKMTLKLKVQGVAWQKCKKEGSLNHTMKVMIPLSRFILQSGSSPCLASSAAPSTSPVSRLPSRLDPLFGPASSLPVRPALPIVLVSWPFSRGLWLPRCPEIYVKKVIWFLHLGPTCSIRITMDAFHKYAINHDRIWHEEKCKLRWNYFLTLFHLHSSWAETCGKRSFHRAAAVLL